MEEFDHGKNKFRLFDSEEESNKGKHPTVCLIQ